VGTIIDNTELYRPLLPINEVTLAMEVSELTPGEVVAVITGGLQRV
jgi:hypothetical protein